MTAWISVIRYFCHTDLAGPRADFCAGYAEVFLALGYAIRIIPVEMADFTQISAQSRWAKLRMQFATPVSPPYVNVVCAHPFWWGRHFTVGVRNLLITGDHPDQIRVLARTAPRSAVRLAQGTHAEEAVTGAPEGTGEHDLRPADPFAIAMRYHAIIVPTPELVAPWADVIDQQIRQSGLEDRSVSQVVVVGLDLAERAQALRRAVQET